MAARPSPALTIVGRKALHDVDKVLANLRVLKFDAGPDEKPLVMERIDIALDRRNDITCPWRANP
jgi:hypothetical protein